MDSQRKVLCRYRLVNGPICGVALVLEPKSLDPHYVGPLYLCSREQECDTNCLENSCPGRCGLGDRLDLGIAHEARLLAEGEVELSESLLEMDRVDRNTDREAFLFFGDFWKARTDVFPEEDHERLLLFLEFLGEYNKDSMVSGARLEER